MFQHQSAPLCWVALLLFLSSMTLQVSGTRPPESQQRESRGISESAQSYSQGAPLPSGSEVYSEQEDVPDWIRGSEVRQSTDRERVTGERVPSEKVPNEEIQSERVPSERVPSEKESSERESSNNAHREKVLNEKVPSERVPSKKVPSERVPSERVPSEEIPSEKVPSERVPSEKIPSERVPSERVPIEKVLNENVLSERITNERLPSARVPSMKVPSEEILSEKVPTKKVPSEKVPSERVPSERSANERKPTTRATSSRATSSRATSAKAISKRATNDRTFNEKTTSAKAATEKAMVMEDAGTLCAYRVVEKGEEGRLCFRHTQVDFTCPSSTCRQVRSPGGHLLANMLSNGSVLLQWTHDDGWGRANFPGNIGGPSEAPGLTVAPAAGGDVETPGGGAQTQRRGFRMSCWWNGSYTQFECASVILGNSCRDFLLTELHENVPYRICLQPLWAVWDGADTGALHKDKMKTIWDGAGCVDFSISPSGMQDIVIAMTTVGGAICVMLVIICLLVAYITENIMSPSAQHTLTARHSTRSHNTHL